MNKLTKEQITMRRKVEVLNILNQYWDEGYPIGTVYLLLEKSFNKKWRG